MRLTNHANKLETNTQTVTQDFGIGDASVVIEILRNRLYEHKIRTLVQEYISNGRDAQREAKSLKKMLVTVPNHLNPVFKVRDFGLGITPDRMRNVFVLYGASTKRGSNNQTGGFGIGAKSAWSYTDSFTIVSVTDGIKRTYVAHTGSSNTGRLEMISEVETDEENGTEIQVAVKPNDCAEFREAVFRAIYFWDAKEMPTLKGVTAIDTPERIEGLKIGQNLELVTGLPEYIRNSYNDKALLVIDGIPYPITDKISHKITNLENLTRRLRHVAIIKIGNGIVEVSASREAIADSDFTKNNLNRLCLNLSNEVTEFIKTSFKAVKSNKDWIDTYTTLSDALEVDGHAKYGDYSISQKQIQSNLFKDVKLTAIDYNSRRSKIEIRRDHSYTPTTINLDDVNNIFYLDNADSLVIQNRRIREYFESNKSNTPVPYYRSRRGNTGSTVRILLISAEEKYQSATAPATGRVLTTDLKTSNKIMQQIAKDFSAKKLSSLPFSPIVRQPRDSKLIDRTKEHFTIHRMYGVRKSPHTTTLAEVTTPYLYIPLKDVEAFREEFADVSDFIEQEYKFQLCALSPQSIELVQGSDLFKSYREWVKEFKPTEKVIKRAKSVKAKNLQAIAALWKATDKIKDKHIVKMLDEYKGLVERDQALVPNTIAKWVADEIKDFVTEDEKLDKLLKECYPLVLQVPTWTTKPALMNELVIYINSKN